MCKSFILLTQKVKKLAAKHLPFFFKTPGLYEKMKVNKIKFGLSNKNMNSFGEINCLSVMFHSLWDYCFDIF